ncbi:MAG TPA: hypothetical protein VH968_13440 [Gaiellaceae bacterium]|jgi:uncharacterized delta-60 repeat protein
MRNWRSAAAIGLALALLAVPALGSSASDRGAGRQSVDLAYALGAGPNGTLTVAGLSRYAVTRGAGRQKVAVARYTAAGTLDQSFGIGGRVLTDFGARSGSGASSLAVGRDGKTIVAGWAVVGPRDLGFALARYTARGKLDRTFGRNGRVLTYFGGPRSRSSAASVAIQSNGKVVAAGFFISGDRSRFALARYTLAGRLDRTFGRGGTVLTGFGRSAEARAVKIQPDGKIVVAGSVLTRTPGYRDGVKFALARYRPDGTLDRRFGTNGWIATDFGRDGYAAALVVQADGKLVATGPMHEGLRTDLALVRYTGEGKLDVSFGVGGVVVASLGNPQALAIQPDRKLVTAGTRDASRYRQFGLARRLESGSLDPDFGDSGVLLTDFGITAEATGVVVQADGKIVAAGTVARQDFALARYTDRGTLDGTFGRDGKVLTDFGSTWRR